MPPQPIPVADRALIARLWREPDATAATVAAGCGYSETTCKRYRPDDVPARKIGGPANPKVGRERPPASGVPVSAGARLPDPAPEAGGPSLPEPVTLSYDPFVIDTPGWWLIISDLHVPYHDKRTIETAVREAEAKGAKGVLLNGDVLDFYQLSRHYREPDKARTKEEIEKGRQLLEWLRSRFPRARLVLKEGNHDERLRRYLAERAPELFDLDDLRLPDLLRATQFGVEWVADKRVIELGKLCVVHGHEYAGGGGVMPARWLFIRSWANALCGHFHQPSHYTVPTLDRREIGVWSVGCSCYLYPAYRPQNPWRHGFALVEVSSGGAFQVTNREILRDGRVV